MKNCFITGLVLIFPFTLAILLTGWLFYLLSLPYSSLFHQIFESMFLSRLLSLIAVLLTIVLVGFLGQYYLFNKIGKAVQLLFRKTPFVKSIYHAAHEVVMVLSRDQSKGFSEAVLVNHPSPLSQIVGFVPRRDITLCPSLQKNPLVPIFIPGTVNPFMGFLIFTTNEYIKPLNISTKEAFIWTISLGGKSPEKW